MWFLRDHRDTNSRGAQVAICLASGVVVCPHVLVFCACVTTELHVISDRCVVLCTTRYDSLSV